MPKLYRVILPVSDIEIAQEFYSELLQAPGKRISPGRHYFNLGGVLLAIYDPKADGDEIGSGWRHHENQYIYISVENIDIMFETAKSMEADLISANVEVMPWGERLFYLKDPSGNPISFVQSDTVFTGGDD